MEPDHRASSENTAVRTANRLPLSSADSQSNPLRFQLQKTRNNGCAHRAPAPSTFHNEKTNRGRERGHLPLRPTLHAEAEVALTSFLHLEPFAPVLDLLLGLSSRKRDKLEGALSLRQRDGNGNRGGGGVHDVEGAVHDGGVASCSFEGDQASLVVKGGELNLRHGRNNGNGGKGVGVGGKT